MSSKIQRLSVAVISLTVLLLLVPPLAAQISAKGGFVAAPANTGARGPSSETPARPVAKAGPKGDKVSSFGNLMIIYFEEPGLTHYAGTIAGLEATAPTARGEDKLDPQSAASRAYLGFLNRRQNNYLARIQQKLSRDVQPVFRYRAAVFGVAVQMSRAEGKQVEKIPGVVRVIPDRVAHQTTDRGAVFIGATAIWNGSGTGGLPGTKGEGVVVGILDSGVNMDHPSFAETGGDGYTHINPNGSGVFLGWCNPSHPDYDPAYVCNDKLIGGWDYMDAFCITEPSCNEADGPEDNNGHGSHTASTTAGNILVQPGSLGITLAGISPHSNIIVYDVCYTNLVSGQGLCPFSATSAAADQAILDGVDAINYSITGGIDPWGGDIDTFFLENMMAGTFVAASAGNGGPGAATVNHLGPWLTSVAASTHDRGLNSSTLTDLSGGTPPADLDGASTTKGFGPATIVHASDAGDAQCLNPFAPGTWSGEIVVCDRGSIARVLKCAHVAAGGASGCVLANVTDAVDPAPVLAPDPHVVPAIHLNTADGDTLRAWLATPGVKTARITPAVIVNDPAAADIMADFSSRGPNTAFSVLKPDVSNPGVDILAAVNSGDPLFPAPEFGWISGTSMSSPHTAGAGALLTALRPDWTPAEIKSALMLTANSALKKEDGTTDADPWDIGAGRVDLTKAGETGLILNETYENFLAADPSMGRRPETLNLASLKHSACVVPCTWQRTFSSPDTLSAPAGIGVTWNVSSTSPDGVTVTADSFQLTAGEEVTVEFTAEAPGTNPGDPPVFAQVELTNDAGSPTLHMPVVLTVTENNFFNDVRFPTTFAVDSRDLEGLRYFEPITDLTVVEHGLVQGSQTDVVLDEDPTNGDAYDDLSQVFWKTVNVLPGDLRLFAVTSSDEAPDVDLFVGTGNIPSAATEQCASTTPTADELCTIDNPAAGTWWILVQNWAGSVTQPDLIELLDGLVPDADMGNLTVTGPATVNAGEPFSVNVTWNLSTMSLPDAAPGAELWFGAFSLARDDTSAPIETTFVTIEFDAGELFADGFESGDTSAWSNTVP